MNNTIILLRVVPIALGTTLFLANTSLGSENSPQSSSLTGPITVVSDLTQQTKTDELAQVTSVTQLSDVQPTDWTYQALQSLVERYGCIAGYPNGTFRGNRAATRYELAAALNACLDQISDRFASKEDLEAVKALQEEFKDELATLRGRVDSLEARTAALEAQQFSTTTKLTGQVIFSATFGQDSTGEGRPTVINRTRLNFNTSFTGDDLLFLQLQTGNAGQTIIGAETADSPFSPFARSTGSFNYIEGVPANITLHQLFYTFKPARDLSISIGPRIFPDAFVDFNTYANAGALDFNSGSFLNNALIMTSIDNTGGAGAALDWKISGGPFSFRAVYTAGSPNNAIANPIIPTVSGPGGLFGDPYQGTVELEYADAFGRDDQNKFAVRLQYTNAVVGEVKYNTFGLNAEATLGQFGIFGRFGIGTLDGFGSAAAVDLDPKTFIAGFAVNDLFIKGSRLSVGVGQPFIEGDVCTLTTGFRCSGTQTNIEAFYRIPVNDNITVTPAFIVILDANNNSTSPTIYQGVIRTVFSF